MLICTPVQEPALFFSFPILPFCFVVVVRCMRVQRERERGGKKIQACVRSCIEAPASKNGGGPFCWLLPPTSRVHFTLPTPWSLPNHTGRSAAMEIDRGVVARTCFFSRALRGAREGWTDQRDWTSAGADACTEHTLAARTTKTQHMLV